MKQGESAKLELSCEDGHLNIQLPSRIGHPDQRHFPDLPQSSKKFPSQLCHQERQPEEAQCKAAIVFPDHEYPMESVYQPNDSEKDDAPIFTKTVSPEAAEKSTTQDIQFKCDQCIYESASDKQVKKHIKIKHKIS